MPPVSVSFASDPISDNYRMVVTWAAGFTADLIREEVVKCLQEGVRKHMMEDVFFRNQIEEGIKAAVAAMPLETIRMVVKEAINEAKPNVDAPLPAVPETSY